MSDIINIIPNYEPKISDETFNIVDLNIRDLQKKYKYGCICCGNTYLPSKYYQLISQHFNTKKHNRLCLEPAIENLKNNYGDSSNYANAFEIKCKENRELKKLNYNYKQELDKIKEKYEALESINIEYQQIILKLTNLKKNQPLINCENLIDL
jgi:hypothetical protein